MARIRVLPANEIRDQELQRLAETTQDEQFGAYGNSPDLFRRFYDFFHTTKYGGLIPLSEKELVRLKVARINGCQRCQLRREAEGDIPYDQLIGKLTGRVEVTDRERLALAYTERFATDPVSNDDDAMAEMRQFYSDGELVELSLAIGAFMTMGRMHVAFDLAPSKFSVTA